MLYTKINNGSLYLLLRPKFQTLISDQEQVGDSIAMATTTTTHIFLSSHKVTLSNYHNHCGACVHSECSAAANSIMWHINGHNLSVVVCNSMPMVKLCSNRSQLCKVPVNTRGRVCVHVISHPLIPYQTRHQSAVTFNTQPDSLSVYRTQTTHQEPVCQSIILTQTTHQEPACQSIILTQTTHQHQCVNVSPCPRQASLVVRCSFHQHLLSHQWRSSL